MASIVSEVMDRLPNPDGGFRRRFTAGIIFFVVLAVGIFIMPGYPELSKGIVNFSTNHSLDWQIFGNTAFVVIIFSIVFSIGTLIEIFSYVFLGKLFSLVGGTFAYRGLASSIKGLRRRKDQNAKPDFNFSTSEEAATYTTLPAYVKDGITNPYGRKFEVAFRYLLSIAPDEEKNWLVRLDSRNQNLFSLMSAVLLAIAILAAISIVEANAIRAVQSQDRELDVRNGPMLTGCIESAASRIERDFDISLDKTLMSKPYIFRILATISKKTNSPKAMEIGDQFNSCVQIAEDASAERQKPILSFDRVSIFVQNLFKFFLVVGAFILVMSFIYSFMLRDSISSALEMLSLRKGIVTDGMADDSGVDDQETAAEKGRS